MSKKLRVLIMTPNLKGVRGGVNRIQPALGVGYLTGVLREAGHDVVFRDTALEGYDRQESLSGKMMLMGESEEDVAAYIGKVDPDIIGISVLFSNLIDHAYAIARIAKGVNPLIKVVLGGNHISSVVLDQMFARANPEANIPGTGLIPLMREGVIDYAIQGEADFSFLEFVNQLSDNPDRDLSGLPGLVRVIGDQLQVNPRPPAVDVTKLPFPARDLMNMEGYFKIGRFHSGKARSNRVLNVMASRGCPEKCTFCTTPVMWGNKIRWREPHNIYEEIRQGIERYRIQEVQFEDDTLTAHRKNLLELCRLVEPLGIRWCTPNGLKVNYHYGAEKQLDMFKRMAASGCYQITLACESGVQRVLDDVIHKNLQTEQIAPTVENAKKAGLMVHSFWLVGLPGETREEMEETVRFAGSVGADSYSVSILNPLPGTPIYHKIAKERLWWEDELDHESILYRNSLVRVDGFDTPEEVEEWVEGASVHLNRLLEKRDPERFASHYGKNTETRFLLKQT